MVHRCRHRAPERPAGPRRADLEPVALQHRPERRSNVDHRRQQHGGGRRRWPTGKCSDRRPGSEADGDDTGGLQPADRDGAIVGERRQPEVRDLAAAPTDVVPRVERPHLEPMGGDCAGHGFERFGRQPERRDQQALAAPPTRLEVVDRDMAIRHRQLFDRRHENSFAPSVSRTRSPLCDHTRPPGLAPSGRDPCPLLASAVSPRLRGAIGSVSAATRRYGRVPCTSTVRGSTPGRAERSQ